MIKINCLWPTSTYGPCDIKLLGKGWCQNQEDPNRILLDINLVQRQWLLGVLFKQANLRAVLDTGSPHTIISLSQFERAGFKLPNTTPTNLGIRGVVRKSCDDICDNEWLWGWRDVSLLAHPFTLLMDIGVPTCPLKVMVARNVDKDQFLVGLDFLRHYPLLMYDRMLILAGRDGDS